MIETCIARLSSELTAMGTIHDGTPVVDEYGRQIGVAKHFTIKNRDLYCSLYLPTGDEPQPDAVVEGVP
jgi:hypothetical protein